MDGILTKHNAEGCKVRGEPRLYLSQSATQRTSAVQLEGSLQEIMLACACLMRDSSHEEFLS